MIDPVPHDALPSGLAEEIDRGRESRMLSSTLPVQIWAHRPDTAAAWLALMATMHGAASSLDPRLRELVRLKIASITNCRACQIARKTETVSEDDVACLSWDDPRFSPSESAAIHFAELFAQDYFGIDAATYEALAEHFTTAQMVELHQYAALMLAGGRMTYVLRGYPDEDAAA
ncbi:carboxymuconolactone decarboxylase family protein [Sphingomonas sp. BAUL-RG-20F-R05-02]|uniref:carboxymuconolactone decarboxylase family protein n=1 Tax=Sphingomonas sp. BAUL-RG-20F-R05-02 TaxID=2914830 RepID=UPI001F5AE4F0|nr:carboxymuconolactone decarboxylase family protein [Sphingomonas sp. BAUL-RG-20F-R05-02]